MRAWRWGMTERSNAGAVEAGYAGYRATVADENAGRVMGWRPEVVLASGL
jgi:hypothetical protein